MYYTYGDTRVEVLNVTTREYELYFYDRSPKHTWVPRYDESGQQIPLMPHIEENLNLQGESYDYSIFKTEPYEHQKAFLEYSKTHNQMMLLDEPGLGKTKQSLDLIANRKAQGQITRALIICGVSNLQYNWLAEVKKHTNLGGYILGTRAVGKSDLKTRIGSGKDKADDLRRIKRIPASVFIINIEALRNEEILSELQKCIHDGLIEQIVFDELHKCKNMKAKQTKALLALNPPYKLGLTGTPIVNSPMDLYPMMKWLGRTVPPMTYFKQKYCVFGGFQNHEIVGYRHIEDLSNDLTAWSLRRTKQECLDLPEKIITTIRLDMLPAQEKLYKEIQKDLRERAEEIIASASPMGQLVGLRKAVNCPPAVLNSYPPEACAKVEMLLDILEERINCGEKVVIFTYHVFTLEYLNWVLNNHGYHPALVYGNLSQEQREANINAFQNIPECKVILGNYQTMGTGINLTASSTVVEYELPWTAVDETQAQDRCHRIGQFNPVSVIRLVTNNTTDEMNERIVDGKAELSENILDVRKMVGWALGLI